MKYIIKQLPPESAELSFYFDGDTFTERAGGIQYALFVNVLDRRNMRPVINEKLWWDITEAAEHFTDIAAGYSYYFETFKECMSYHGMKWSPRKCHELKAWAKDADPVKPESIAEYLTITTGHKWSTASASGYSQGDYAEIVYCADIYSAQDAEAAGEIALGAANEYSITFPAEDAADGEPWTVYGYIVADCQAWRPEDVKRLVCSWEGIDPAEAVLMIPGDPHTVTTYEYSEVC